MNRSLASAGLLLLLPLIGCGAEDPAEWVRSKATPLASFEPGAPPQDLEPLQALVGEARVVALGQPTYGTRETFLAARRIAEHLVAQGGFSVLALEAGANETRRVDEWVHGGQDNPRHALAAAMEWSLECEEMLDFVRALREQNAAGHGVRVRGFGLGGTRASVDAVRAVLPALDPAAAEGLDAVSEAIARGTGQEAPRAEIAFAAEALVGKDIRSSGFIKTEQVTGGNASLSWQALDGSGAVLLTAPMEGSRPSGTTGWIRYDLWMKVPPGTERVRVAMLLTGNGTAWFDGLHLLADNEPYAWGIDLDFESTSASKDLVLHGLDPRSGITQDESQAGESSLALVADLAGWTARTQELLPAARTRAAELRDLVESHSTDPPAGVIREDLEWALAGARGLADTLDVLAAGEALEPALARNVQRIVESSPEGAKILVWTHDTHASRRKGRMGAELAAKYGAGYLAVGSTFYEGTYRALGPQGLAAHVALRPPPDGIETQLHATGIPSFLLDLRGATIHWLTEPRPLRAIGPRVSEVQFETTPLAGEYDLLLHVDRTSATKRMSIMGD